MRLKLPALLAVVGSSAMLPHVAFAAEYSWVPTVGATNYDWNNSANWDPNTGFPFLAGDIANVNNNIVGNQTIRLQQAISLGILNLSDAVTEFNTNPTPTKTLYAFTITNEGSETFVLTFDSGLANTAAQLNLGASGIPTNAINAPISLNSDLSLSFGGTDTANAPRLQTGGVLTTNGNNITIAGGILTNPSWTVVGDIQGAGTITHNGLGGINVNGTKSFTGTFVLNRGVSGSSNSGSLTATTGSIANAAEVVINGNFTSGNVQNGGSFHAGNNSGAGTNPGQRFTQNRITLNGGSLSDGGQTASAVAGADVGTGTGTDTPWRRGEERVIDTVANVDFNSGYSQIFVGVGGNTSGTTLNITTLERGVGATGWVRGSTLGGTARAIAGNAASFLVGAGGADGTTTKSIVPWLGAPLTNGSASNPEGFVTHTATGFRRLTEAEQTNSITAGATHNVKLGTFTLGADATVNALHLTGGTSNMGAGRTLSIASGGLFLGANTTVVGATGNAGAGTVDFGAAEGVVWALGSNTNTIGAVINGSGGLTKASTGTLVLTGANTYTGQTHVSGGTLQVGNGTVGSTLGDDDVTVHAGAILSLLGSAGEAAAEVIDVIDNDESLVLYSFGLFNGKVNIASEMIETVGGLSLGGVFQGAGYYGSSAAAAANPSLGIIVNDSFFTGTGAIQIIPEPASLALVSFGLGMMFRRTRR